MLIGVNYCIKNINFGKCICSCSLSDLLGVNLTTMTTTAIMVIMANMVMVIQVMR